VALGIREKRFKILKKNILWAILNFNITLIQESEDKKLQQFILKDSLPMSQPITARQGFRQIAAACDFGWKGQNP